MSITNPQDQTTPTRPAPRLPEELVASPTFLLKRLGHAVKERGMQAYESAGLHPYHFAILIALEEGSHETQGAIADALGYDRGQLVQATAEGKRTLRKLRTLSRQIEDEFLAPLSEDERAQLHALLFRLAKVHDPRCAVF